MGSQLVLVTCGRWCCCLHAQQKSLHPACLSALPTTHASIIPSHLASPPPHAPGTAAYFVFLGMLAVVACLEPAAARYFSDWWSEHELEIRLPKLPLVLKVGGRGRGAGKQWYGCEQQAAPLLPPLLLPMRWRSAA